MICRCGQYEASTAEWVRGRWRCAACGDFQPKRAKDASSALSGALSPLTLLACSDGRFRLVLRRTGELRTLKAGHTFARAAVPAGFTAKQLLACVNRELAMRRRVYPAWIASGRVTQAAADAEIRTMNAVREVLEQVLPVEVDQAELFKGTGGRR